MRAADALDALALARLAAEVESLCYAAGLCLGLALVLAGLALALFARWGR